MKYRPEIDGLRALAVIPVILFHAGFQTFSGGFVGVDVFFVISGYLITSIIVAEIAQGRFSIVRFYERRARRILPALFLVMFACLPFAWLWLLPSGLKEFSNSLIAVSLFISNVLFWRTSGYFSTDTELYPLLHTWSLAVEEQYYLIFPIFLLIVWKSGIRWVVSSLSVIAIASLGLAQWASVSKPAAAFYLLPTRVWELLIGAGVAFYLSQKNDSKDRNTIHEAGGWLGLLLLLYAMVAFSNTTPYPSVYALAPTIGTALIIVCASARTAAGRFIGNKLFVSVGLVSYSAYLWHQPLFAFARNRLLNEPPRSLMVALIVASLALSYFSWKYVEIPFRNRDRFSRNKVFTYSAILTAFFITIGIAGNRSNGFLYRYSAQDQYLASLSKSEAGSYVEKRFLERLMKQFDPTENRKKILIIGDSFAEDLVNALYESNIASDIQLSTRHISHRCGNLFIERDKLFENIAESDREGCSHSGLFDDTALRKLMQEADEIWFASSWTPWQAARISESVENVIRFAAKPVRVFGTKNFGDVHVKSLLRLPVEERTRQQGDISPESITTNELLRRSLRPDVFVDIQELMCGTLTGKCLQFSSNGALVSYDGGHLTSSGARYLGDKLMESGKLANTAKSD